MTRLIGAVMAVALLVSVAPVLAGDSFHTLSRLPADLTPLDDAQLATVEGGFEIEINLNDVAIAINVSAITQVAANVNAGDYVKQAIEQEAEVKQSAAAVVD